MGYDLKAKNPDVEGFHFGAFSWGWLLDAGVGLAIFTGPAIKPLYGYCRPDENGYTPQGNDGYSVSEDEAKMMAHLARAIVFLERERRKEWNALPLEEQKMMDSFNTRTGDFNVPVRDDFVDRAERFAEWAEKSGGFTVH